MSKPRKEIKSLVLMLAGAVFLSFMLAVVLVYYYGSSGTFPLKDILISPDAIERIGFTSENESRFTFNKIEFVLVQSEGKGWGRYAVSKQSYREFYQRVSGERSLPRLSDEEIQQFRIIAPSTLTIFVQARDNKGIGQKGFIFQEVEFIDQGSLFRVKKRDAEKDWVYFRYPEIYQIVKELFAPQIQN